MIIGGVAIASIPLYFMLPPQTSNKGTSERYPFSHPEPAAVSGTVILQQGDSLINETSAATNSGTFYSNPNSLPDYVRATNELDIVKAFVQRLPDATVSLDKDQKLCMTSDYVASNYCQVFHTVRYSYSKQTENAGIERFWTLRVTVDENNELFAKDLSCGESVGGSAMSEMHPADTPEQIMSECP